MSNSLAIQIESLLSSSDSERRGIKDALKLEFGQDTAGSIDDYLGEVAGNWASHVAEIWNRRQNEINDLLYLDDQNRKAKNFAWRIQKVVGTLNPGGVSAELQSALSPQLVASVIQAEAKALSARNHVGPWLQSAILTDDQATNLARIVLAPAIDFGPSLQDHGRAFSAYISTLNAASTWGKVGKFLGAAASLFGAFVGGAVAGRVGSRAGSRLAGGAVGGIFDQSQKVISAENELTSQFAVWSRNAETLAGRLGKRLHLILMAYVGSILIHLKRKAALADRQIAEIDVRNSKLRIFLSPKEKIAFDGWFFAVLSNLDERIHLGDGLGAYSVAKQAVSIMKADPAWWGVQTETCEDETREKPSPFLELIQKRSIASVLAFEQRGELNLIEEAAIGEDVLWNAKAHGGCHAQPALIHSWLSQLTAHDLTEAFKKVRDFYIRNLNRVDHTFQRWTGEDLDPRCSVLLGMILTQRGLYLDEEEQKFVTTVSKKRGFTQLKRLLIQKEPHPSLFSFFSYKKALKGLPVVEESEFHAVLQDSFKRAWQRGLRKTLLWLFLMVITLSSIWFFAFSKSTVDSEVIPNPVHAPTLSPITPSPPPSESIAPTQNFTSTGESREQAADRMLTEAIVARDDLIKALGEEPDQDSIAELRKRMAQLNEEKGDIRTALALVLTEMIKSLMSKVESWKELHPGEPVPEDALESGKRIASLRMEVINL